MDVEKAFALILKAILFPPGLIILLGVLAILLYPRRQKLATWLAVTTLVVLYLLSIPAVVNPLFSSFEKKYVPLDMLALSHPEAQAIVVLGGGRREGASEYGKDTVSHYTLERLRYAARLHRQTSLPILVTGGAVFGESEPEASLMAEALEKDFGLKARWLETNSKNTAQNARYSYELLAPQEIKKIFLVTDVWHMRRAAEIFEHEGLEVIPAPMGYREFGDSLLVSFLPSSGVLFRSTIALHEIIGRIWYWIRY